MPKRAKEVDKSNPLLKLALRQRFVEKVEGKLCFDLFCGTGTYLDALYLSRFERCVAVDRRRKSLQELPTADNLTVYQGDNAKLAVKVCARYGFPDYVDLDAYGNPDAPLLAMLPWLRGKQKFAVVATDGTFAIRTNFARVPPCWGLGEELRWSPLSADRKAMPAMIYRRLERHIARYGYRVTEFEYIQRPRPWAVVYYGALLQIAT